MTVALSSLVMRNEAIVFTDLDDSIVMMDVDEGEYYELDPIAARIWALLGNSHTAAELCEALAAEYDIDSDTCRQDTLEFLQTARNLKLVHIQAVDTASASSG